MADKSILIVEDEIVVAQDLKDLVSLSGYEVVGIVDTASDAVKEAGACRPDLVLMDINLMGEKDGIDAAKEIKDRYNIPSIYITAYTDKELIEKAEKTSPYAYIVKPFSEKQVATCIKLVLYKENLERKLDQKINELKKVSGTEKTKLEEEIEELKKRVDAHKKELMLFIDSSNPIGDSG